MMVEFAEIVWRRSLTMQQARSTGGMTIPKDRTELFADNFVSHPHIHQVSHMQLRCLKTRHLWWKAGD